MRNLPLATSADKLRGRSAERCPRWMWLFISICCSGTAPLWLCGDLWDWMWTGQSWQSEHYLKKHFPEKSGFKEQGIYPEFSLMCDVVFKNWQQKAFSSLFQLLWLWVLVPKNTFLSARFTLYLLPPSEILTSRLQIHQTETHLSLSWVWICY